MAASSKTSTNIYLLIGDDSHSISRRIAQLKVDAYDPMWEAFNCNIHEDPKQALCDCRCAPFGTGGRFVLVRQPLPTDATVQAELDATLPGMLETTTLVWVAAEADKRTKAYKAFQRYGRVEKYGNLADWDLRAIAERIAVALKEQGLQATDEAMDLLVESVGGNLSRMAVEVEKLAIAYPQQLLTADRVAALVESRAQSALKLGRYCLQGNIPEALNQFRALIDRDNASSAIPIIASLIVQFRRWLWVKLGTQANLSDQEIAEGAEIRNPKQVYWLKKEVAAVGSDRAIAACKLLLEWEIAVKTHQEGKGDNRKVDFTLSERKVIELCLLQSPSSHPSK